MRSRCRLGVDVRACVLVTVRGGMSPGERSPDANLGAFDAYIYVCVFVVCMLVCSGDQGWAKSVSGEGG